MTIDTAYIILTAVTLAINYTTMFLALPRRFGKLVSIGAPILYSVAIHIVLLLTGTQTSFYRFWGGFAHFPLYFFLSKSEALRKVFVVLFVMVCTGYQLAIASAVAGIFTPENSGTFWLFVVVMGLTLYTIYLCFIAKYARQFFDKLFASGSQREWALYSFGAAFSYIAMVTAISVSSGILRIVLLSFAFWSFCILCFAIINTHEKTKKSAEASFASGIISSGRDHYQRMDEIHEKLRILRHDYQYHMTVLGDLAISGDHEGISSYLSDMQAKLSENEMRNYCANPVVNALLSTYAERCDRSGIAFETAVSLPEMLSIPNYDLCIILGNLLENAMDACSRLTKGRRIELWLKPLGEQLALMVQNSYDGKLAHREGGLASTKRDGGLGLKSVETVATRYDGELTTTWDADTFTAGVTVRL